MTTERDTPQDLSVTTDAPASTSSSSAGSGPSRRTVLASVGLAGVGATALAACGAAEDAADTAVSSATDAAKEAISKATIPVGGGKIFADQKVVVTQPTSGDFKAFSAVCTHQNCVVSTVADGTINCACHGSKYDLTTGAVKQGPATKALPEKTITVSGDGISVT
ncbi:Ferredoxin subunit of nitrite reductase or a ring-hydroxylating dioxygenase [Pedococcus dokdonensis]|uniref:Cytochrome bc1 complex Rieske iron-sulfur subunit n=1 Tax=Pedococcus dokdonensis TaxID=443156 RepID=A0A1H0P6U0_9MICO|nr:Rieske (2Fe-2S) protein [Pedococcus dokdonensis]SDP00671.1 Ferredoxin subunit of nitrite reductase or a ring-hydroxylating dioxygenase [Pedococcus dokdonensis]